MSLGEELTAQEEEAVQELRSRLGEDLSPEMKSDTSMFLRFLRARDFNINKSEEMLRNHITWKKMSQIDRIQTDYIILEVAKKYVPLCFLGFDADGSPVRYFAFGNMDSRGLLKSMRKSDFLKYVLVHLEHDVVLMKEKSKKLHKNISQWVYIFNFENYTFASATHKLTLEALILLFRTYEANYPERLKAVYIVNTSVYFNLMFNIIKPLLSGATLRKLVFLDRDEWKEELPRHVDADILPAFLGGNRTDPDGNPLCNTVVNHGGQVDPRFFTVGRKCERRLSQRPDVRKLSVSRMSKAKLAVEVAAAGSTLEWEFETESRDIGFGLFFRSPTHGHAHQGEELIPTQRIDTELASEVGMFQCQKAGTYLMVFDNSYSWLQTKEIYCSAAVVTPTGKRCPVLP